MTRPDGLTPQQRRVVEMVVDGRTDRQIADKLGVEVQTIRFHIWRVAAAWSLDKQGNTRAQIVAKYLKKPAA